MHPVGALTCQGHARGDQEPGCIREVPAKFASAAPLCYTVPIAVWLIPLIPLPLRQALYKEANHMTGGGARPRIL